jgi:hypothetical protein
MNPLDPRAIALQGIGSSPRLVAVQGLWPSEQQPQPLPPTHRASRKKPRKPDDDDVLLFML